MGVRLVGAGYSAGLGTDARISISSPSASWSSGQGDFEVAVKLRRNTSGEGPYSGIAIGIAPQDDDGVTLKDFTLDADNNGGDERASVGATTLRHGRLKIANAYGSDVLPLPVEVQAQAWDGTGFVNFKDDNCTPLDGGYFILGQVGTLTQPSTSVVGAGTLGVDGKGRIALTRPSPAITGKAMAAIRTRRDDATPPPPVLPGLESYLPGVGTGTFGLYKSGPVLYRRELHY
jgi:MSHA biogenesis protein MshQ